VTVEAVLPLVEDKVAWPVLVKMADCLCKEIVDAGLPPTCICSPFPGEAIAADYVTKDEGMAWVRVSSVFPSANFPAQDQVARGCLMPLAVQLEVGVLFCAPVSDRRSTKPPRLPAMFDSARMQMAAMAAMLRAIECCLGQDRQKGVALGAYTPIGPEGGVVGGSWLITVAEGVVPWHAAPV
jgi:hypothetical protein